MLKIIFVICTGLVHVYGNCGPCPSAPRIYEENRCVGQLTMDSICCPSKWICPDISQQDPAKCYFEDQVYDVGTDVNQGSPCATKCTCVQYSLIGPAVWDCKVTCPNDSLLPIDDKCRDTFSLDECCSTGRNCDAPETLHKCLYRGTEALQGERFTPPTDSCYVCLCDENFQDHTFVSQQPRNCYKKRCNDVDYSSKWTEKCAPVYENENSCCPVRWICPSDIPDPKIVEPEREGIISIHSCNFGNLEVKMFYGIETNDESVECSCQKPPLLTCKYRTF